MAPSEHLTAWARKRVFGRMRHRGLVLLAALVLQLVMYPLLERNQADYSPWIIAYWLATPLLGAVQLASRMWMIVVSALTVSIIATAAMLSAAQLVAIPGEALVWLGMGTYLTAAIAVGRAALFSEELVDNRVYAGISAYLLIGYFFAAVHHWVAMRNPMAYQIPGQQGPVQLTIADFLYFSFSTLTTAGFGDITAVSRGARLACMLEAVTGVLVPATFIARLLAKSR